MQKEMWRSSGVKQQKSDHVSDIKREDGSNPRIGREGAKSRKIGNESKHAYVKSKKSGNFFKRRGSAMIDAEPGK